MELVEGETLAEIIGRGGSSEGPPPRTPARWGGDPPDRAGASKDAPLPIADAVAIARQIADALEAAHEKGIVHRDLKPANVRVTPDGVVKVLDFGLAKALDPVGADAAGAIDSSNSPTYAAGSTRFGIILGTAAYMSPEQARGQRVDRRTDIWAFGCVLYEMLAGRPAFGGPTVTDVLAAIVKHEPDWSLLPADVPSAVRRTLARCLQKDLKHRLRDIGDARLDLEEAREPASPVTAGMHDHRRRPGAQRPSQSSPSRPRSRPA
jgi:serine/threonine protein kinase